MTGLMDSPLTRGEVGNLEELLTTLRKSAVVVNKEFAKKIGISPSASITCVKPSGTVSQLVDAASGIHARHAEQYIRTVRADNKDPLCMFMKDLGFPHEADVSKPEHTTVFAFPIRSPKSVYRNDMTAIEQLKMWLVYQENWCEHKPSVTITVRETEWMEVGAWVYKHFDKISGISFLPHSDHSYKQAPYQDCTIEEYEALVTKIPTNVDWLGLSKYEKEDNTVGTQTYACSGDKCEIVDIVG